jgi:hypothetical protein
MSAFSFVALVIVLAFATGFVVAAIIWLISWAISPKKEKSSISGFMKVYNSYYKPHLNEARIPVTDKYLRVNEETKNKEIYKFYHGKN